MRRPLPAIPADGPWTCARQSSAQGIALDDVADLDGALGTSAGGRIQIQKGLPQPRSSSSWFTNSRTYVLWLVMSIQATGV